MTREAILATVWPGVLVEEGNVGKAIHAIRIALGDRDGKRTHLETIPKHGYRFLTAVTSTTTTAAGAASIALSPTAALPDRSAAYDLYIRGRVKTGGENIDDINEAIALLESAVHLDPSFACAYAQLARAYSTRSFKFASQDEGRRLCESAEVALAKALDLEPNLAEVQFARGIVLWTKAKGFPHEQAI